MALYCALHFLLLNPDIPLGDSGGTMLEQLLYQRNIVSAVLVDLRSVILSEAVGADAGISQIITDLLQVSLDGPLCQREDSAIRRDRVVQAIAADKLIEGQGHCECPGLPGLLLYNRQPVAFPVSYNVLEFQPENIGDPEPQVGLQHEGGCNGIVWPAAGKPLPQSGDDLLVLLCGQRQCFLVQIPPPFSIKIRHFARENTTFSVLRHECLAMVEF